ncbi:hypothetical protein CEXT_220641 [Caerostris extrusa]|uniref:Uncharacterized protein n=1 Tax=Caerostris extrusa TaxID=172846 RepID=A0AAV4VBE5_CAEEX|nr:hypothetical protein CEXT_220641 [Caerostris extrusa]
MGSLCSFHFKERDDLSPWVTIPDWQPWFEQKMQFGMTSPPVKGWGGWCSISRILVISYQLKRGSVQEVPLNPI